MFFYLIIQKQLNNTQFQKIMTWYDQNAVLEWKTFIGKAYNIENVLFSKDIIVKELPQEKEVQDYLKTHRERIVEDGLNLCLQFPCPEASYERKYLFPTKAIELMTNQIFFSNLGWDGPLMQKYFHFLMKNFFSVDPHVDNVNLYHAYFQRLLRMLTRSNKVNREQLVALILEQQKTHNFIGELMKHAYKYSIVTCFSEFLNMDWADPKIIVSCELKKEIINSAFGCLEQHVFGSVRSEPEKIQNMLILIKIYLEEAIKYLTTTVLNSDQKIVNFKEIYSIFQRNYHVLINIIKNEETCLKMVALETLQLNQLLLVRIKNREINEKWSDSFREDLINHIFSQKVGIIYSLFIEWLIILFSDVGQNPEKIDILCSTKAAQKLMKIMIDNKANNILVVRIIQFLKVIFMNIEKQILLNIQKNKNIDSKLIKFKLFEQFFRNMSSIQTSIKSFKSYNELLFTHLVKIIKIFYQFAINIDSIFTHYNAIPQCIEHKPKIIQLMELYQKEPCFQLFQHQLAKQLGTFFEESVFQHLMPPDYSVTRPIVYANTSKKIEKAEKSTPSEVKTNVVAPSVENEQSKVVPLAPIENTVIQIKFNDDLIKPLQEDVEPHDPPSKQTKKEHSQTIQMKADINNMEDIDDSFESYKRKKLEEAQKIIVQKRSKSRTPTKMKNQLKKSKNRWGTSSQVSENQENKSVSVENLDRKKNVSLSPAKVNEFKEVLPPKISIIKLNERRRPKTGRQRLIESCGRDSRLTSWLKLLKELR